MKTFLVLMLVAAVLFSFAPTIVGRYERRVINHWERGSVSEIDGDILGTSSYKVCTHFKDADGYARCARVPNHGFVVAPIASEVSVGQEVWLGLGNNDNLLSISTEPKS